MVVASWGMWGSTRDLALAYWGWLIWMSWMIVFWYQVARPSSR